MVGGRYVPRVLDTNGLKLLKESSNWTFAEYTDGANTTWETVHDQLDTSCKTLKSMKTSEKALDEVATLALDITDFEGEADEEE